MGGRLAEEFSPKCQCNDTCGATSITSSPFRKNSKVQIFTISDKVYNMLDSKALSWFYVTNVIVLIFVGGHGILGLIEVKFAQAEV